MKRRYAIIGCGGVGGYYGGNLARAGNDVHFLLHRDYPYVHDHGLRVDSKNGDFRLPRVYGYRVPEDMPPCDVVMVALKATQNHLLPGLISPLIKPDGSILLLQNGLGAEQDLVTLAGGDVMGGLCFLCSRKIGPGHIEHQDYGAMALARHTLDGSPGGETALMRAIADDLRHASIDVKLHADLALARWKKLVWNIPFNGLTVVRNTTTANLMRDAVMRALVRELMEEVAAAARACARPIEPRFIDKMMNDTDRMVPYLTSMKLDYDHGRPMEINAIYERPLAAAKRAGVNMPRTRELCRQLREMDRGEPA